MTEQPDIIASADTWIESAAVAQLRAVAALPGMQRAVGMPDLHPGRGTPIGAAFAALGLVYPHLVGSDIGCGMGLWSTEQPAHRLKIDRLEKTLDIDDAYAGDTAGELAADGAHATAFLFEEAPEAYKPVRQIVDALERAGMIRPLAVLSPLLTYKTRSR